METKWKIEFCVINQGLNNKSMLLTNLNKYPQAKTTKLLEESEPMAYKSGQDV